MDLSNQTMMADEDLLLMNGLSALILYAQLKWIYKSFCLLAPMGLISVIPLLPFGHQKPDHSLT